MQKVKDCLADLWYETLDVFGPLAVAVVIVATAFGAVFTLASLRRW